MNISKKLFPFIVIPNKARSPKYTNYWRVYDLPKKLLGNVVNTWFTGIVLTDDKGRIYRSELWTVKKVDDATALCLYGKKYNPVSLVVLCPTGAKFQTNVKGETLYNFKAMICSCDNSSYGMWWKSITLHQIDEIKKVLMRWLETQKLVNGDQWFEIGKENGAVNFDTN